AFPTRLSRSSSLSGWRELARAPAAASGGRGGCTAARRDGPRRHGAVGPAPAQSRARKRPDSRGIGGARRPGATASRGGCGGRPERAGGPSPARRGRRGAGASVPAAGAGGSGGVGGSAGGGGGERLRFQDFTFQRLASGRCRAKVVLTWADGRQFTGESDGVISQAGELRCCAEATVRALERVVQPRLGFELLGV